MKKAVLVLVLSLAGAGYVYLQPPAPKLAALLPGGAILCLEAPDFARLLREWDASKVKADWLASANYAAFSRSNLFLKLNEVYAQYSGATRFEPALKNVIELAGDDSALALYEPREVEFLYVSRISEGALAKAQLWALRDKFEQRQAGGAPFYLRADSASGRTVAFAFVRGYLFVATRDDLVAQALELLAGGSNPSVASDRWYREATGAAGAPGELRLVMNLETIVRSSHFRSYWIQRNASAVKQYWAAVADIQRSSEAFVETRRFLRSPDFNPPTGPVDVSGLSAFVPPDAGLYKAFVIGTPDEAADLVIAKVIGRPARNDADWRYAPSAIALESRAGTEADLETRIDEQPLAVDPGVAGAVSTIRQLVDSREAKTALLVQTSAPAGGPFVTTPAVVLLEGAREWDRGAVRSALSTAAATLWTTARLGAGWTSTTAGRHSVDRLDGLGALLFAVEGRHLFVANDVGLLARVLERPGRARPTALTYAAGFRHSRERGNYGRLMGALDFGAPRPGFGFDRGGAPPLFSANLASLSAALSSVAEVQATQEERGAIVTQHVTYTMSH